MKKTVLFRLAAALLSAALLWAAFPPQGEVAGLAVALAPMLLVARLSKPAAAARWFFVFGFVFWFANLSWMPAVVKNNGPWPLVALGWGALSCWCAGYFALFGWLDARLWRRAERGSRRKNDETPTTNHEPRTTNHVLLLFAEAALWAGCEWLRGTLFTGFAWNFLGTALGQTPSLAGGARLGGVYLLSALVVLLNGVFATLGMRILRDMRREEAPRGGKARLCAALETALPLAAILLVQHFAAAPAVEQRLLRVALVQRNAPCVFANRRRENPLAAFGELMETATAARPDLVVWAESAMAEFGPVRSEGARAAALHLLEKANAGALVAGGDDDAPGPNGRLRAYNAAALFTPNQGTNGVRVAVYHKQHLVPFGEFIPLDKWIPALQKLSPIGVSLHPGEPTLFSVTPRAETGRAEEPVRLAPLICFEDTDPRLTRQAAANGAQAIVLVTNDSWFSHSAEAEQHALQAILRAVETGLPVIRAGNSGVTGVVRASGRVRWLEDDAGRPLVDQKGALVETVAVPAAPAPTPYVRFGDAPLLVLFALAVAFALLPSRAPLCYTEKP